MTSAIGMGIISAGHRHGWAVAAGGSRSITNAMVALLADLGGKIETGVRIEKASQLPAGRCHDVRSGAGCGRRHPRRPSARRSSRVPSPSSGVVQAHSKSTSPSRAACPGRTRTRVGRARCTWSVTIANSPPPSGISTRDACPSGRSFWSVSSIWPTRNARSATSTRCGATPMCPTAFRATRLRRSLLRSSGSRRVSGIGSSVRLSGLPPRFASYNPNYVGGDIMTGAKDIRQLTFGPRITLSPYRIGVPGMYICSAATPPGPGRARHVRSQRSPTRARLPRAAELTPQPHRGTRLAM